MKIRLLTGAVAALFATVLSLSLAATPAYAAGTGRVDTGGSWSLIVRSAPTTSASVVRSIPNGTSITLECWVSGSAVSGRWGVTSLWHRSSGGYVSDGFVYTGTSGPAPGEGPCTATPPPASSRADAAVKWMEARIGSTSYEGWCERAVENAYGTQGRYGSALADWNAAVARGTAHRGDLNPPRGALVFWNISSPYGHVGIARGDGTFVATSVKGRIGTARLPYYSNYLGWAPAPF